MTSTSAVASLGLSIEHGPNSWRGMGRPLLSIFCTCHLWRSAWVPTECRFPSWSLGPVEGCGTYLDMYYLRVVRRGFLICCPCVALWTFGSTISSKTSTLSLLSNPLFSSALIAPLPTRTQSSPFSQRLEC